jgi:hypothetical protein
MATTVTNPFTPAPIQVPNGSGSTSSVDKSIIPYMRLNEIEFVAHNLAPHKDAHVFFEDVIVDRFVQNASVLKLDGINGNTANMFSQGDVIYCNTTHSIATVISYSGANTLYVNENYIAINIAAVGANTLDPSYYSVGDLISQSNIIPNSTPGSMTFSGTVVYYNSGDGILVVTPLFGSLVANNSGLDLSTNANPVIYNNDVQKTQISYARNVVSGARFTDSTQITNITKGFTSRTAASSSYISYSGVANTTANNYYTAVPANANTIIASSNVPSIAIGNTLYITSGTGFGQINKILSVDSDNVTIRCQNAFSSLPDSTSLYSYNQLTVDDTGMTAGIFQLPESPNLKFLSGYAVMTITDSMIINDPNSLMKSTAYYYAGFDIPTSSGASPLITPMTVVPNGGALINPGDPSSSKYELNPTNLVDTSSAGLAPGLYDSTNTLPGVPRLHPLAQTFTTPKPKSAKTNYGIFVTSIDLWFSNKPVSPSPQLPVVVKLATVVNGIPTSNVLGTAIVQCSDIVTINIASNQLPDTANIASLATYNSTSTKFKFKDPIYLNPATDYAIIVYAESPDYDILTTEIGQTDLASGSALRKVSKQPGVGDFFTSQNSSQWTPIPNVNMMFSLNKAQFSTDPVTWNFKVSALDRYSSGYYNDVLLTSSATTYPSTLLEYKIQSLIVDYATNTLVADPTLTQINPGKVFNFGDKLSTSALNSKSRWLTSGNTNSIVLQVDMQSLDSDVNPTFNSENLGLITGTNVINNGGLNSHNFGIINPGIHFSYPNVAISIISNRNSSNTTQDPTVQLLDGISANANVSQYMLGEVSGKLYDINVWNRGSGYVGTPSVIVNEPNTTVPIVTANVISGNLVVNVTSAAMQTNLFNKAFNFPTGGNVSFSAYAGNTYTITDRNLTVQTATSSGAIVAAFNIASQSYMSNTAGGTVTFEPQNAIISSTGEDQASGGNALCRYHTKQIVLADGFDSGDLRVWIDGIIPNGTSVQVYYKVMSRTDVDQFKNKKWQLMAPVNPVNSPDQQTPVEIQYADYPLIGGNPSGKLQYIENGTQYPLGGTFKYFAIKLVLFAADPSVPPVITGLRAIAVPAG